MIKVGKVEVNNNLTLRGQVLATIVVMLMCMLMAWLSLRDYITVGITRTSEATTATVMSSEIRKTRRSGKSKTKLFITYSYAVGDEEYTNEEALWWARSTGKYPEGKQITVVYSKNAPEKSRVRHFSVVLLAFAAFAGYIALAGLAEKIKQSKNAPPDCFKE